MDCFLIGNGKKYHTARVIPAAPYSRFEKSELPARVLWNGRLYRRLGSVVPSNTIGARIVIWTSLFFNNAARFLRAYLYSSEKPQEAPRFNLKERRGEKLDIFSLETDGLIEIPKIYQRLIQKRSIPPLLASHPLTEIKQFTNSGLALIAHHLKEKGGFKNLVVCGNLDAMQKKIKEIAVDSGDSKTALVVPSHQFEINPFKKASIEQHHMAVCVEKKGGHLHIAVIDPSPDPKINQKHINFNITLFTPKELVFSYIKEAGLDPDSTTYYFSIVGRQYGKNGGCGTFALRDAVHFLKNPDFFKQIDIWRFPGESLVLKILPITTLPLQHMKSTQSMRHLSEYFLNKHHSKDLIQLHRSLDKHKVEIISDQHTGKKYQNRYIDDRTEKYQKIMIQMLQRHSDKEINQLINGCLIR